ncbi:MAG TPA: TIGR00266 family protein [Candidatus Hydrogenedentes bacterium]|nr:TIGR00266 family protein [Candidatus Hydrogenedentota bacterium]
MAIADEIDYTIHGTEMQFVEIGLDPGESVLAEAGGMMYMTDGIEMSTRMGTRGDEGALGKLLSAGKRVMTGESLFITVFTYKGQGKGRVAFGAPYPGKIVPMNLAELGTMLCQKDSYLCSADGIDVGVAFSKRFGAGLFGGEGFILQKLSGNGWAFCHAGGTIVQLDLKAGQKLRIDTGCIAAFQQQVGYDIQFSGGVKTALFGGEGLFLATLTGPGRVFLQSLPFSRLAGRMYAAASRGGGKHKGEGSLLGGLGSLIGGDNR